MLTFLCRSVFVKATLLLMFSFFWASDTKLFGRVGNYGILMTVERNLTLSQKQIISTVVKLENERSIDFEGSLHIDLPVGFKSISGENIPVFIPANGHVFVPLKLLVRGDAAAGSAVIKYELKHSDLRIFSRDTSIFEIEENKQIRLSIDNSVIYITNNLDSVAIQARVNNIGNVSQEVRLIFGIPNIDGNRIFIEQKGIVQARQDTLFVFKFLPTSIGHLRIDYFTVNVSAMKGQNKELFGNAIIAVQNVASTRRYSEHNFNPLFSQGLYPKNAITASYRAVGENSRTLQLIGNGNINLPIGNISFQGNIFKSNLQDEVVGTNTSATYRLDGNELTVGNISEAMEVSLFGRGVKTKLKGKEEGEFWQVGFIDHQYNIFSKNPLFQNGYSVFASGKIGATTAQRQFGASYILRQDPFENALHNIAGAEVTWIPKNGWNINGRIHGAVSKHYHNNKTKPSAASEVKYFGTWKDIRLNGSYYYSTSYFPGNRRGMLQLNQSAQRKIGHRYNLHGNVFYSNFAPQFFYANINMNTQNLRADIGITLPRIKRVSIGISYQYQYESSNAYDYFLPSLDIAQMQAHRLVEHINWTSSNLQHHIYASIENGLAKYLSNDQYQLQLRANLSYKYKSFNLNGLYQRGGYFLSEQMQAVSNGSLFRRLALSAHVNQSFFRGKVQSNIGLSFTKDYLMGNAPSAFANLKYKFHKESLVFFNTNWYRYNFGNFSSNEILMLEGGISLHLPSSPSSDNRKSKVNILVFFDKNANNIFDEEDEPAPDFFIVIGNTSFLSDSKGRIGYSSVPFGNYRIKPISERGWFYTGYDFTVTKHKTQVQIALHQMGSVSGQIQYEYDSKTVAEIQTKLAGIYFKVSQNNHFIRRIITDDMGHFNAFLPTGKYQIELEAGSLTDGTSCKNCIQEIEVKSGMLTKIPPFIIEVKHRKVNIKYFGEE